MAKQIIRLTEQDLNLMVEETVRQIIRENGENEAFGGLKSLLGGQASRIKAGFNNAKALYKAGSLDQRIQKSVQQVNQALANLQKVSQSLNVQSLSQTVQNVQSELQSGVQAASQQNLQNARNNFINRNYQQYQNQGNQQQGQNNYQQNQGNQNYGNQSQQQQYNEPNFEIQSGDGNGNMIPYDDDND